MTLTRTDIEEIRQIVKEEVEEQVKYLPTKDEFYEKMDEAMGELRAIRDEQTVISGRVYDNHEERITALEEIHPDGKHPSP